MNYSHHAAVAAELLKYSKIVETAHKALNMLHRGQPVDALKISINRQLDDCEFTKTSSSQSTVPLHSAPRYLSDTETLKNQILEAEQLIREVVAKIQDDVGPFYTKEEVKSFEVFKKELDLDWIWIPSLSSIRVTTYHDAGNAVYIQSDWQHNQYRTAKDGETFGPWKSYLK